MDDLTLVLDVSVPGSLLIRLFGEINDRVFVVTTTRKGEYHRYCIRRCGGRAANHALLRRYVELNHPGLLRILDTVLVADKVEDL